MQVELIPVIEIGYNNPNYTPNKYPYWDYPELWDELRSNCYAEAGFKDKFTPYLAGASFYKLSDITDGNLAKLVTDHTRDMRNGVYAREESCTFFGGYVLIVNEQDKYFPQCCGELKDIVYWENLANQRSAYYEGHPAPQIEFVGDKIIFDFSVAALDEIFQPPPAKNALIIDKFELKNAVEKAKVELKSFEQRLEVINLQQHLFINDIGKLLIWGD